MRTRGRLALLVVLAAGLALGGRWLWVATSVGAGYAAKVVCSLVFDSGQDAPRVFDSYVAHEIWPLGPALELEVGEREVTARLLGWSWARARVRPGLGCTLVPRDGTPLAGGDGVDPSRPALPRSVPWPLGDAGPAAPAPAAVEAAIDRAFAEPDPAEGRLRQTTAIVVARQGRLVAERYAPGYGPDTPVLSWSMAKSVTAALVGVAVAEGRLSLLEPAAVPEWREPGDPRGAITLDQLLRMSSGLAFDETYGATNDVSVMLFTRPDMGRFAARFPLVAPPDTRWSYSSGTANVVGRLLRDAFGGDLAAMVRWSRERLFDPVGMTSAFLEPDASGSFIASSFAFMTARDWARFGELHRQGGLWFGRRVLPEGWVHYVTMPTPTAPKGNYGALWWLNAGAPDDPSRRAWPELPTDVYAARGHSGQYVVVVPSAALVVVRLGLSFPDDGNEGAIRLVADLIRHYGATDPPAAPAVTWR